MGLMYPPTKVCSTNYAGTLDLCNLLPTPRHSYEVVPPPSFLSVSSLGVRLLRFALEGLPPRWHASPPLGMNGGRGS